MFPFELFLACFSPKKVSAGMRVCRREGCGFREAFRIAIAGNTFSSGLDGVSLLLTNRLERSLWIAEHPGCTVADADSWENERLQERLGENLTECRELMKDVNGE